MNRTFTISVEKLTSPELVKRACSTTINKDSNISLDKIYQCMHSPMRTQIFYVSMTNIPTFVATHLVRHVTIVPFVKSNREDRGGENADRNTPVDMDFIANAEALINVARKRLCRKASKETTEVIEQLKIQMQRVDYDLAFRMVPNCIEHRNCKEKTCGFLKKFLDKNPKLCDKESLLDVNSWYVEYNKWKK